MSTIGKRIQARRKAIGLTQEELAKRMGYKSKSTINKIELGVNDIPQSKIARFAEVLGTTPAYLMGWEEPCVIDTDGEGDVTLPRNVFPVEIKRIPLLGEIACGTPIFATEEHESYVAAASSIGADFCLRAKGDSMIGARIHDGDMVFIRRQPIVENGEIAAVVIGDEATLKRWYYYPDKHKLVLTPENPAYEPLVYLGEELNEIRCLGKAVCFTGYL